MKYRNYSIFNGALVLIIISILVLGLWQIRSVSLKGHYVKERVKNEANYLASVKAIEQILPGDLVVRRGDDMTSAMLASLNKHDKRYSHCGLVVREKEGLYVIHSIGGEDNPNQKVKKERIEKWVSVQNNLSFAVYRFQLLEDELYALINECDKYYQEGRMFDIAFDLQTDDKLYCSEMIYKAFQKMVSDSIMSVEEGYGRVFVGVDNLYKNSHTQLVCDVKYK